ncbi:MAG: aspartate aminotransferase family protein [Bacteroidetes bacterium CG2_30_32_10]|nr:MAG: aspartate aminotransferase family protein [Bacteroidetes bacterium CG2_30_32_10]
MLTQRQLSLQYLAQTSNSPIALEIVKAEGVYLYDLLGKEYIDLISGISVSNVGHRHPKVVKAIKEQLDKYMHLMVYGEYIQSPQVLLAQKLVENLPSSLNNVYLVNSGSEAIEGALKLAKRFTRRTEIIAFKNAYHGSTQGALSIMGNEEMKNPFRPLLSDITFLEYNNISQLNHISNKTACVIAETVQGEAGVIVPNKEFFVALRKKCNENGAILILDEIQTGFGRTGSLFCFQQFGIVPDIITIAKGMGGGMPIGAFIASKEMMNSLADNPALAHITTFGGNPVCCAAALATLNVILEENLSNEALNKEKIFRTLLKHPKIKSIYGRGLLLAIEWNENINNIELINRCINKGVIVDWFLFCANRMRIAPPLTITPAEIEKSCHIIIDCIEN